MMQTYVHSAAGSGSWNDHRKSWDQYTFKDLEGRVLMMVLVEKWELLFCCASELLLLLHSFDGLFSRTTWVSRSQKGKTSLDLNETRDDGVWGCSGISWTICKQSAPRCRQITTPTPHHSVLQARCSSWRRTSSAKAPKALLWCRSRCICVRFVDSGWRWTFFYFVSIHCLCVIKKDSTGGQCGCTNFPVPIQ